MPLIYVSHLQVESEEKHFVLFCSHHILFDGWSIQVLQQELLQLYTAALGGNSFKPVELPFHYGDYALWQRQQFESNQSSQNRSLDFWMKHLKDAKGIAFPYDRIVAAEGDEKGGSLSFRLPKTLSEQLYAFCRDKQVTPFVVMLACYQRLLSLYAQQNDIAVAVPVNQRNFADAEKQIGLYPNLLVLRSKLSAQHSIESFIVACAEQFTEALAHQHVPIEKVLDTLRQQSSVAQQSMPERLPGEQFGLVMLSAEEQQLKLENAGQTVIRLANYQSVTHKHDLCLYVSEITVGNSEREVKMLLEFDRHLLTSDSVKILSQNFVKLLKQFLAESKLPLVDSHFYQQQDLFEKLGLDSQRYENVLPLSSIQKSLYLNRLIYPDDVMSQQTGFDVEILDAINADLWQKALIQLTQQYAGLRSKIMAADFPGGDFAYQLVFKKASLHFVFEDLSGCKESHSNIQNKIRQFVFTPFKPDDFLVRHGLFKLNNSHFVMVFSTSHMLFDAVCAQEIWKNLKGIYHHLSRDSEYFFQGDKLTDYFSFERRHFDTDEISRYWQSQLANASYIGTGVIGSKSALEKKAANSELIERHLILDDVHWQSVKNYCRKKGVTPQLYFKGVYGVLLKLYSREAIDLCISEFQGVRSAQFRNTLTNAFSITPYVYRKQDLFEQQVFSALLESLARQQKNNRNKYYLSETLYDQLISRDQVGFYYNYLSFDSQHEFFLSRGDGKACLKTWRSDLKVGVAFEPKVDSGSCSLNLYYHETLFEEYDFLETLHYLSEQILAGEDNMLALRYVRDWKQASCSIGAFVGNEKSEDCVIDLISQQAQLQPDAIALKMHGKQLSYLELERLSNQIANYLQKQGATQKKMKNGEQIFIALQMTKSFEAVAALLATWKLGFAYVVIDPLLPAQRQQQMLQHSGACFVLGDKAEQWQFISGEKNSFSNANTSLQDAAYLIYTSGSTGEPKGVLVKQHALLSRFYGWQQSYQLSGKSKHLQLANLSFDVFVGDLLRSLCAGGTLVLMSKDDAMDVELISDTLEREAINFVEFVPAVLRELAHYLKQHNKKMTAERVVVGSDVWFPEDQLLIEQVLEAGVRMINSYGITETVVDACYLESIIDSDLLDDKNRSALQLGNVGVAYPNTRLYVLDAQQRILPKGITGELYVAGNNLAEGYWQQSEVNQQKFSSDYFSTGVNQRMYRSGDLAKVNSRGEVLLSGRADYQINIRGHRIELGEIENQLKACSGVNDAVLIARDEKLIAYVQVNTIEQEIVSPSLLRAELAKVLPAYMLPAHIEMLTALPLNANGKIDRKALPDIATVTAAFVAPINEPEISLAKLWQVVLQVEKIGRFDNFFELGGHSLLLTRLVTAIEKQFGTRLPLRMLFEHANLNEMAVLVKLAAGEDESADLEEVDI